MPATALSNAAQTAMPLPDWMKQSQARTETALHNFLPGAQQIPLVLHEAMRYAVLDGGKRVRALLVLAAGESFNAKPGDLDRAACALELIHAYSLVHDDMPCMDNDALRRGKPTVHIKFGEATALLAGDALQSQAFLILAGASAEPARQLKMIQILAHAAGSLGMCGGQAIDLASVGLTLNRAQLEQMHQLKTGALLRASVLLGALCGQAPNSQQLSPAELGALDSYSHAVGLAFQVVDDILDATADSIVLGKTAGKDAANHKPTYVSILGLDASRVLAEQLRAQAHEALTILSGPTLRLRQLADFIVQRNA